MSQRFDRTRPNDPRGGKGEGRKGVGEIRFEPIASRGAPRPRVNGGGGAGRQVEQVEKEACCCAAIERQTPRALLSLGGGSKLEGCGPRVNVSFILCHATRAKPPFPPSLEQPFREISFHCYSNEGPTEKKRASRCLLATCTHVRMYTRIDHSSIPSSSSPRKCANGFSPPSKLSFLPPFLLSFPRSRKF